MTKKNTMLSVEMNTDVNVNALFDSSPMVPAVSQAAALTSEDIRVPREGAFSQAVKVLCRPVEHDTAARSN